MKICSIYICDTNNFNKDFIAENFKKIPNFRQKYCSRYLLDFDKMSRIAAYLLLEKGLKEQYGINNAVSFVYNKNGKPYLCEYPNIFFSFSHCKNYVVCALSGVEIGVDIQDICSYDKNVANRVCSEAELEQLSKSDNLAELFCRIWTKKESYVKAKGIKLIDVLKKDLPNNIFFYSFNKDNFYLTLCFLEPLNSGNINFYCEDI